MSHQLAVLASGTGSILAAMIEQGLPIKLVVVDRNCGAFEIAKEAKIPSVLLPRTFGPDFDRCKYTQDTLTLLCAHEIGLVAMDGFMTVFSSLMFEPGAYQFRFLNTHPSLLPSFKGNHAVRDALDYGVKISGCTIYMATAELDAGLIIAQEPVPVITGDTEESLHERIKEVERKLYPKIIQELIKD
ncbi:MAG: formyltransferase family protein [Candidatus Paceibacterota bacterium]